MGSGLIVRGSPGLERQSLEIIRGYAYSGQHDLPPKVPFELTLSKSKYP